MATNPTIVRPAKLYSKAWLVIGAFVLLTVCLSTQDRIIWSVAVVAFLTICALPAVTFMFGMKDRVELSQSSITFCRGKERVGINFDDIIQLSIEELISGRQSRRYWVFGIAGSGGSITVIPIGDLVDQERTYKLLMQQLPPDVTVQKVSKSGDDPNAAAVRVEEITPPDSPFKFAMLFRVIPLIIVIAMFVVPILFVIGSR